MLLQKTEVWKRRVCQFRYRKRGLETQSLASVDKIQEKQGFETQSFASLVTKSRGLEHKAGFLK